MSRDIRATRDRLGLTTQGLADLVGVNRRTASRWAEGSREVPEPVWRLLELIELTRLCQVSDPKVLAGIEVILGASSNP